MSKAFGEESPTLGEDPVSWQTFTNGSAVIPDVVGDVDWGKLKLDLLGQEGRSAVYDLGAAATRKFTLTENRYGTGAESATIQIRGDTSSFAQDDVTPVWETYTAPVSKGYRYVQVRATTVTQGWWLSGGISAANCIAAYRAKGAATLSASKVNLANPSTYDLVEVDAITWTTETGWTAGYFTMGYHFPSRNCSVIGYYSNQAANRPTVMFGGKPGSIGSSSQVIEIVRGDSDTYKINNGGFYQSAGAKSSGSLGYAYLDVYDDGIDVGDISDTDDISTVDYYIMRKNQADSAEGTFTGYLHAISFYNTVLTSTQMLALHNAMAAL